MLLMPWFGVLIIFSQCFGETGEQYTWVAVVNTQALASMWLQAQTTTVCLISVSET